MKLTKGNILEAEGIKCIPVNMVGVAGAGLARQWANENPDIAAAYKNVCKAGLIRTECVVLHNFWLLPTKDHWRDKSQWPLIEKRIWWDLYVLSSSYRGVVNVPKVGCGLGGLDWKDVEPKLIRLLNDVEDKYGLTCVLYA